MEFLSQQAISFLFWVPSIMVAISNKGVLEAFDLPSLRTVFFAGEVFPMKHLNHWRRTLPKTLFVNLYGPIEITVDCTYYVIDREFADDEALPIGFPCRNSDILILNEWNRHCSVEERGELCVRGTSLAMGYWNDPEKTSKAFVQNPLNTNFPEIIYRTGDVVYRNRRGEIMFVGRQDFQIKHMGYRIELPEIEYQALSIQEIANACVLYNQDKKEITLFYETRNGVLPAAAIRQRLMKIFPKYMVPTAFHQMTELPRNPNGKIDRNGLEPHHAKAGRGNSSWLTVHSGASVRCSLRRTQLSKEAMQIPSCKLDLSIVPGGTLAAKPVSAAFRTAIGVPGASVFK